LSFKSAGYKSGVNKQSQLFTKTLEWIWGFALEAIAPVHKKQLLTYLRLTDKRLGLLINFNVELIKNGISRVVNGL